MAEATNDTTIEVGVVDAFALVTTIATTGATGLPVTEDELEGAKRVLEAVKAAVPANPGGGRELAYGIVAAELDRITPVA
jgi:hypothetical protein